MGEICWAVFSNQIFQATFWAWLIVQIIKSLLYTIKNKRFNFRILVSTGGMPSSHSSGAAALTTAVGRTEGFNSSLFIITLILAIIIMNDAAGVRRAAGQQARILNKILEDGKMDEVRLKELLGHTPFEVIIGGILGVLIGVLCT